MVVLGDLVTITGGGTPSRKIPEYWEGKIPWATVKDFKSLEICQTLESITLDGLNKSASNLIPKGTIIIPTRMAVGKAAINTIDVAINQDLKALFIKDKTRVDRDYLFRTILNNSSKLVRESKGATVKGITLDILKELKIPLPSLKEQKRIAAILDKADAIRRKRQYAIDLTDQLLRSVFLDMFGDPVTNPKGWKKEELQNIVNAVIDCPHSTPRWTDKGKIAIRTSNLTVGGWNWDDTRFVNEEEYHQRSKRSYVEPGDIVLSREGTVGIAAIVQEDMDICLGQRLVQLKANMELANSEYILHVLLYELEPERLERVMVGATSKHLNVRELRQLKIPLPPIEIQQEFKKIVTRLNIQRSRLVKTLATKENLFSSLTEQAFKGELTKQTEAA